MGLAAQPLAVNMHSDKLFFISARRYLPTFEMAQYYTYTTFKCTSTLSSAEDPLGLLDD